MATWSAEPPQEPPKRDQPIGCFAAFLLLFIAVFFAPISWIANKIGGSGSAAAFGSFGIGVLVTMLVVGVAVISGVGVLIYFFAT